MGDCPQAPSLCVYIAAFPGLHTRGFESRPQLGGLVIVWGTDWLWQAFVLWPIKMQRLQPACLSRALTLADLTSASLGRACRNTVVISLPSDWEFIYTEIGNWLLIPTDSKKVQCSGCMRILRRGGLQWAQKTDVWWRPLKPWGRMALTLLWEPPVYFSFL